MRKTKIVCTLGPSTDDENVLREMIRSGMNVARFNFSHGDHKTHLERLEMLRKVRDEEGKHIAALLDTKGPEIRVKKFVDGKIFLEEGQKFTLTTREVDGTNEEVSITYANLPNDISAGTRILIDDGLIEMVCDEIVDGTDIVCHVVNGGAVSNNKGVNVPDVALSMPYISEKDKDDILFGIKEDFDFIAASFVRTAGDVLRIRRILEDENCYSIKIIAKIENRQGVENIDEIIQVSDGVMVARGDMGVEIPSEDVPVVQKMIIRKVVQAGKHVITATQMLDSMIKNPRPTRAETADVANAIYDGTSAVMLSGETAAGLYPVESVRMMAKIAERTEQDIDYGKLFFNRERKANPNVTDAISHAACTTAHDLKARAILNVTKSGSSARMISKYRPSCDIVACSTYPGVCRQMNMAWGITPILVDEMTDVFELFDVAIEGAKQLDVLKRDDLVVLTAGVPLGISGTTNMLRVQVIGRKY